MISLEQDNCVPLEISLHHVSNSDAFHYEKAYEILAPIDPQFPSKNIEFQAYDRIAAHNARAHGESSFTLEKNGFQFLTFPSKDGLTTSAIGGCEGEVLLDVFFKQLEAILRRALTADAVILYDWRLRSYRSTVNLDRDSPSAERSQLLPPAEHVHADESSGCGHRVVMEHLSEAERTRFGEGNWRIRIINIWRPLVPVVQDSPLALCDWSSVKSEDWELCDQIHTDRCDEALYLKYHPRHQWFWLPEQSTDELTLFTVWDSKKHAQRVEASTPHTAFDLPNTQKGRESIEVRSIVWTRA